MEGRLSKHSNPRLGASITARKRLESGCVLVGKTNGEHTPILPLTKKHSNCSNIPHFYRSASESKWVRAAAHGDWLHLQRHDLDPKPAQQAASARNEVRIYTKCVSGEEMEGMPTKHRLHTTETEQEKNWEKMF